MRKEHSREEFVREHVLCHIVAGELQFTEADAVTLATAGDTILFRRNLLFKCEKRPTPTGKPFKIVFFVLERDFLRNHAIKGALQSTTTDAIHKPVLFIQPRPPLQGLLNSLYPYIKSGEAMSDVMMVHKLTEAILTLIEQNEGLDRWLFDFGQQGKLDLHDFMEKNFMFNVPMQKFAELTGRSLSTFQRDFHKIFGAKAGSWLLKRRLQAAYESISEKNKKPGEIYLDLGFEDIAHFSRSFKNEFGFNPSQLIQHAKTGENLPARV